MGLGVLACGDDLHGIKILYVEDDKSIRDSLARFLGRRSCELITAADGAEGLEKFKEHKPDIVITDIRMPVMNGLDMIERVRRVSQDIPIVITTAHNDEEFYQRAIDLGVDKYIKKPVSLRDLMNIMTRSSKIIIQQRELEAQAGLIKKILDVSQNFMIITDGLTISYANKALLDFSRCGDIECFRRKYPGLSGLLTEKEDAFYSGREMAHWIEAASGQDESKRLIVYMKSPDESSSKVYAYVLQINKFPGTGNVLLSFSDVTDIEHEKLRYQEMAQYDELTKIYNRKKFNDELEKEIDRVGRYGQHLSLTTFDVDNFKVVNDTFGHLAGDHVLKEIVRVVNSDIRKSDIFARYGGEEFSLLMPETPLAAAVETVERIRRSLESHSFREAGRVTCSFGVTEFRPGEDTPTSFIKRSDDALYMAKNNGRNRVEYLP